jgi:hypothetical protein
MNAETTIDWECWEVEEAPSDFADRVLCAALAESRPSGTLRRTRRSARWMGALVAAAVAGGSLTVLAMMQRGARRSAAPSIDPQAAPNDHAPLARSAGDAAKVPRASRVPQPADHAGTVVDRELRDAVRARLVLPLQAHGVELDPHTGLTIPAGSNGPSHNLSKEYLTARIREDFYPLASACYASALAKLPQVRGQIVVDFMIVGDAKVGGIVDQAKINERTDIADPEFTGCIRESMLSMIFAPPENNGWVTVTYPFKFAPGEEDEGSPRDE